VQSGRTALDFAKNKGHTKIEVLLLHKGAKVKSELCLSDGITTEGV